MRGFRAVSFCRHEPLKSTSAIRTNYCGRFATWTLRLQHSPLRLLYALSFRPLATWLFVLVYFEIARAMGTHRQGSGVAIIQGSD